MKKIIISVLLLIWIISCWTKPSPLENVVLEQGEKIQILALGDSITAWYNLPIADSYPAQLEWLLWDEYEIINAWVSWDTSKQLLDRLNLYIEDDDDLPNLAIVTIGWNDGLRWQSLEDLENNLTSIVVQLQQKNIPVIIAGMQIPINLWFNYSRDFKKIYSRVAKQKDTYFYEYFLQDVGGYSKLNLNDGIHPNKQWYEIIANNIYNFLQEQDIIK